MTVRSFADAVALYEAASSRNFERVPVVSPEVDAAADAVNVLSRATRELQEDDYWRQGVGYFKRAAFLVRATPLRVTDPALGLLSCLATGEEHFSSCAALYPEYATYVESAALGISNLFHSDSDLLSEPIDLIRSERPAGRAAVVLATRGLHSPVQAHLRRATADPSIDVLGPRDLLNRRLYDLLFIIGSPDWYTRRGWGWVFNAPRGRSQWLIGYAADSARPLPQYQALSGSRVTDASPRRHPPQVERAADHDDDLEFDWKLVADRMAREVSNGHAGGETVEARLYVLAGGYATFLSTADDSRVQALDPEAPPGARIVNIAPPDLEPGAYVLLRTEGGGDLVVIVANSILGKSAAELRGMQAEWKSRLRELVNADGYSAVVARLHNAGSNVASRANVAHWCWHRSLRTWDRADFDAIMSVTGLGSEADAYWKAMGALDAAHRKAGFAIRERLEQQAEVADLESLDSYGMADFSLPEGGGALTAYRVEEVASAVVMIPEQHVGRPMRPTT